MKMSKWFHEKTTLCGDTIEDSEFSYAVMSCEYLIDGVDAGAAICHAINNHDRMVEEIAELRNSEADLVNRNEDLLCIIDDLTRIAMALDKPEKHTNSQHKRAKRDLCKLLAKLNQEG